MDDVHKLAKRGIRSLLLRQVALQGFTFAGGIVLARVLDPADFGVFGITTFLVHTLALLADFGLSQALIQRRQAITERDLQVGFTIRHTLVVVVMVALWFGAPLMASFYPAAPEALVWLIRALALSLYLQVWRATSLLQLERELRYDSVAVVEVVESLAYQITAVAMALAGFGVWSLVGAVLLRGALGAGLMNIVAPWRVRFAFDLEIARELLRFGLPFQVHKINSNLRTWVTPTIVAAYIGADAVGFLMWAAANGRKPLVLVENVVRVSLPHFSRLQHDVAAVEHVLGRYVVAFLALCGLWLAVLAAAGHDLVAFIYTEKWLPGVGALVLYAVALNLTAVTRIVKTALSGVGRVAFVMRVTLVMSLATLAGSIPLVFVIGFIAVPIAEIAGLALMLPWLLTGLEPGLAGRLLRQSAWVVLPLLVSIAIGWGVQQADIHIGLRGGLTALAVSASYVGLIWLRGPEWMRTLARDRLSRLGSATVAATP